MTASKRKTKETPASGRTKRARVVSSDDSADDGIDEGREESENMLRQSASKKQEPKWHVEMKEQITQGKSELLQQLKVEKEKIALRKNRRNQELRALVKSINPGLFQLQTPAHESREIDTNDDPETRVCLEMIAKHRSSDEHLDSMLKHSTLLYELADMLRSNYASSSNIIAKAKFPASITDDIQKDRRKLLAALENGRRVAEADIKILTTGATAAKMNERKKRVNGRIMDEEVEVREDSGMQKWRRMLPVLRAEATGADDDKENQCEGDLDKRQVEGKSIKCTVEDACKGVEKMTRGLPEPMEIEVMD